MKNHLKVGGSIISKMESTDQLKKNPEHFLTALTELVEFSYSTPYGSFLKISTTIKSFYPVKVIVKIIKMEVTHLENVFGK